MTPDVHGGCVCGRIRYRLSGRPLFGIHCFCRQCQRMTGAGHASLFAARVDAVALSGRPGEHVLKADSGADVTSGFCPQCGNPILKRSSGYPDLLFFHAATLDEPAAFRADRSAWTDARHAWDPDPCEPGGDGSHQAL